MKLINVILILALFTSATNAQESFKSTSGKITIEGTSSLHDWDMTAGDFSINAMISRSADDELNVKNLILKVKVESLKSKKGNIMDNKTYDALKEKKNPYIYYTLDRIQSITNHGDYYLLKTVGDVNIAGVKKSIYMDVKAKMLNNGAIQFEGSKALKMTDFDMSPPTALLGTLKTGDDISILFNVTVSKSGL